MVRSLRVALANGGCPVTNPDPTAESRQQRPSLVLAALLLVAGLLVGVGALVGTVRTADLSPTTSSVVAALTAALPGVLALILAFRRPVLGLAATAGGGLVGVVRLVADLAVVTETDRISRPELFAETTDRARPLAAGGGAWLLLAADLMMLVVGVAAATRLAALTFPPAERGSGDLFGPVEAPSDEGPESTDEDAAIALALSGRPAGRRPLNLPMVGVGFLGAVLLLVGGLGTPYSGGYLDLRILPFGSSLTGLVAAALLAFLAAVVVVVAAALPRAIAQALLCGTALAAAVPFLTAVVAVLTGAPTGLSPVVWWGLAGAGVLAASGLLARRVASAGPTTDPDGRPPDPWLTIGTGVLALVAAGALAGASRLPLLYLDGSPPDAIAGGALSATGQPLLVAAIPLAIAGVLALIPPLAVPGRAAVAVLWAGACYALGQALWAASLVQTSASGASTDLVHTWTPGPGEWLALLGTAAAVAAAVLAIITARRAADASVDVVDDLTLAASRSARRWPAAVFSVVILVSLALPVYEVPGTGSAASLVHGYDLDTWGFWALAVGAIGAMWAAATTSRPSVAAALPVAAAGLLVQPLFVPEVVRATPGFAWDAGFFTGLVTAILLLAAAGAFARLAARVQVAKVQPLLPESRGPRSSNAQSRPRTPSGAVTKGVET